MRFRFALIFALAAACSERQAPVAAPVPQPSPTATTAPTTTTRPPGPAVQSYFIMPSPAGLAPVVSAIGGARSSIRMIMFHLTVPEIVDALIAAKARGVDVRIILDGKNLEQRSTAAIAENMRAHGIEVTASSPSFSITHVKAMVIDDDHVLIMSLNLTKIFSKTRDYAITTNDPASISEFKHVFDADIENARSHTGKTPALAAEALLWSPVNSENRLVALIDSAKTAIVASSENLGNSAIDDAFVRAAARGVKVRVLTPMCDLNPNPYFNWPFVERLDAAKVDARVMPGPSRPTLPYIHAKMMIVDDARAYLGSVNFSENSTKHARELGIIFDDHAAIGAFEGAFESDWASAIVPPAEKTHACSSKED